MVKTSPLELKELLFFVTVQIVSLEPKKIHNLFFLSKAARILQQYTYSSCRFVNPLKDPGRIVRILVFSR